MRQGAQGAEGSPGTVDGVLGAEARPRKEAGLKEDLHGAAVVRDAREEAVLLELEAAPDLSHVLPPGLELCRELLRKLLPGRKK